MTVESLTEAERLHLEHKREWTARIRWRIVECLVDHGRFHAEDLLTLEVPEDCSKLPGTCVGAAARQGLMVRGTRFYATGSQSGHGRKSFEWLITDHGRDVLPGRLAAHRERQNAAAPLPDPAPLFELEPNRLSHHEWEQAA